MTDKACPAVKSCLVSFHGSIAQTSALCSSLQIMYGRAAARQFEFCLHEQEEKLYGTSHHQSDTMK